MIQSPVTSLRLREAGRLMMPGDLLLYRNDSSLQDLAISRAGRSPWCHAAKLDTEFADWRVLQMLQWRGGCSTRLAEEVSRHPGGWDWFTVDRQRWPEWNRLESLIQMRRLVRRPYGWTHVVADGLLHLPLLRFLTPVNCDDDAADWHPPFCSEAVSIADRLAGVDPVPHLPDRLTEPGDLGRSLLYQYRATLIP